MPKANELKTGMIVEVNDEPYSVKKIDDIQDFCFWR